MREDVEIGYSHNARLIDNFVWRPTEVWDAVYSHGDVGQMIMAANPNLASRLSTYSVKRYDMKLLLSVQGYVASQGRLIVYAIPGSHTGNYDHNTRTNCRIVPHVIIDPSRSSSYELNLPFCGESGSYANGAGLTTWRLYSRVYNVLSSGSTESPETVIQIFGSLENVHLSGKIVPMSENFSSMERALDAVHEIVSPIVPKLSPYLTLASKGARVTAEALKSFGFSKPNVVDFEYSKFTTSDNYSQISGGSKAVVLGCSQLPNSSLYPTIAGGTDRDMELSYMLGFPAYIGRHVATSVDVVGKSYAPVNLNLFTLPTTLGSECANTDNPALFSVMARTHTGASGTLRLNLEFVTSVFNRASYLVAWSPPGGKVPTMSEASALLENVIVQVSGNTSLSIDIPFRNTYLTGFNFGTIYIFLLAPLTSQSGTPTIDIDMLLDCSNVQFHVPLNANDFNFMPASNDWIPSPVTSFGQPNDDPTVFVGGDSPKVVKDLTSRLGFHERIASNTHDTMFYGPSWPIIPTGSTHSNFFSIFRSMYYGSRGSIRYSFFPHGYRDSVTIYLRRGNYNGNWNVEPASTSIFGSNHALTCIHLGVESSADVVVPYLLQRNFVSIRKPAPHEFMFYINVDAEPVRFDIFVGSGDDFVFSNFIGVPIFASYA